MIWQQTIHPEDLPECMRRRAEAISAGTAWDFAYRLRRFDGVYRWHLARSLPSYDAAGLLTRWVGTATDIDDLRRATAEKESSERRQRRLFDSNVVGIIEWNLDTGGIFNANDLFLSKTGYTRADLEAGLDFRRMTPPEWTERNEAGIASIRSQGFTPPYEKEYFCKDGSRLPILIGGALYDDSTCEGVSYVVDISDRKKAEAALRQSEERYRVLTFATNQIVWMTNAEGAIRSDTEILWGGFTGESGFEYRGWGWLEAIHPDDRPYVQEVWTNALKAKTFYECEYRLKHEDGTYHYMLARGVPILDADGNVLEWIGASQDIQEQKELQAAQAATALRNERIAETLQRSLLMTPSENAFPGLSVATQYEAAWDEALVGGDFCDVFALDTMHVALVVGDVTGKGLKAAARTAEVKFALRAFLREDGDVARTLARLNRHLCAAETLDADKTESEDGLVSFVALLLAVVNTQTGKTICGAAGAEPPLVVRASGQTEEVDVHGVLMGAFADMEFDVCEIVLNEGDLLVLTTDGITEARFKGELFGVTRLLDVAKSVRSLSSLKAAGQAIVSRAVSFAEGRQGDDVCLLLARRR